MKISIIKQTNKLQTVQMAMIKCFLLALILLALVATLAFITPNPVRADHGEALPTNCTLHSIKVQGELYSSNDPIPESSRFDLIIECNARLGGSTLYAKVGDEEKPGSFVSQEHNSSATIIGFSGLSGAPDPNFASYSVTTRYLIPTMGDEKGHDGNLTCFSHSGTACQIKVGTPPPGPDGTSGGGDEDYGRWVDIGKSVPLAGGSIGSIFPTVGSLFTNIVRALLAVAAIVFLGIIVWGGFLYLNSGGNPDNAERARGNMTGAIIGLLIVVVSFAIIELLLSLTSFSGFESIFK